MSFRGVGVSLPDDHLYTVSPLAERLGVLSEAGADFVEVCPQRLGAIVGGRLDVGRTEALREVLGAAGLAYTVHPPLRLDLMDLGALDLQRGVLEAGVRFAGAVGARVVVCHAGRRIGARDARYGYRAQLAAERSVLREVGELAGELGVVVAVENWCPVAPIIAGGVYAYSVWPSELAEQVADVDHPAVGVCLDVGHAFVAAGFCGFDLFEECAAVAPLVEHVHLHDNLGRPDPVGEPEPSERLAYGLGDLHLPPGRGSAPLGELFGKVGFARRPSCCVELPPDTSTPVAEEALGVARALVGLEQFAGRGA